MNRTDDTDAGRTPRTARVTRRAFAATAVAAGGALAIGLPAGAAQAAPTTSASRGDYRKRAIAGYQAMQKQYYDASVSLYAPDFPRPTSGNPYSYVWPLSQATAATFQLTLLDAGFAAAADDRVTGLERYWNPSPTSNNPPSPPAPASPPGYASYVMPPLGGGGDLFYDDNAWIAQDYLLRYRTTGDAFALKRAKQIFDVATYGWDPDPSHADPGGVYWTQASWSHDRNTISNAPNAEVGLRLYLLTGDADYLTWSLKMFDWVNANLLAPNGLYWDHVDLQGNVQTTQWSYNQGVMLGAAALLYLATRKRSYLDQAVGIATKALDFLQAAGRIYAQDAIFGAIFFRNLLFLDSIQPAGRYRTALTSYADVMWEGVDPASGILLPQPYQSTDLLVQAALVQLQALAALPPNRYQLLV